MKEETLKGQKKESQKRKKDDVSAQCVEFSPLAFPIIRQKFPVR